VAAPLATVPGRSDALPEQLGPYRVLAPLGRGGMGVVYSALHADSDLKVAIKTVGALTPRALSALRTEVHALKRIRHPGVVRILDEGLSEGLPWYAMELLEGRTLDGFNKEIWLASAGQEGTLVERTTATPNSADGLGLSRPLSYRQEWEGVLPQAAGGRLLEFLSLYRGVCAGLDHIHRRGLVHRDLKPSNVFLRDGLTPVLMDFGLASPAAGGIGREALSAGLGGRLHGTLAYLSPEQIRGELVDARADLYALGCIMYESLVGQAPFPGSAPHVVIAAHLHNEPQPPSRLVQGIPLALEELVLKLLLKSPHERIGQAEDVDAALADLGGKQPFSSTSERVSQPYLFRPRLSGRSAQLAQLDARRDRAVKGQGALVLVGGESGVGKTFLAAEAAQRAEMAKFRVITGDCSPATGTSDADITRTPLQPLRRLLEYIGDRCREGGEDTTRRLLGDHGSLLAKYEPTLAFVPGHHLGLEPPEAPPAVARARVLAALEDTLAAVAADAPLLIIIDDLQWADDLSLDFLRALASDRLGRIRVLLIGTYRSDEAGAPIARLLETRHAVQMPLEPLDESTITRMVSDMLAIPSPPQDLVAFITRQSEGNPFFAGEYLRLAVGENLLRRQQGKWRMSASLAGAELDLDQRLPLPRSLQDLVSRRLAGLEDGARPVASAAAVLGREFDLELLSGVLGNQEAVFDGLEALRGRQILERTGPNAFRFVHDRLRQAIYAAIPPTERLTLHHKAARTLELRHAWWPNAVDFYPTIALHWAAAGRPKSAARYLLRSARHARAAYANEDAKHFYKAASEHLARARAEAPEDVSLRDALVVVSEERGDVLMLTGAPDAAKEVLQACLDLLDQGECRGRARIWRKLGKTSSAQHRHDEALDALRLADESLGDPRVGTAATADWQEWIEIQRERIWTYYWTGDGTSLKDSVENLRPVVESHGNALQKADFYRALSLAELRTHRYRIVPPTIEYAWRALTAAEDSQSFAETASNRFNLAFILLAAGDLAEAEGQLQKVMAAADRLGDLSLQVRATAYASIVARRQQNVDLARSLATKTRHLAQLGRMPHYIGIAQANLGWSEFASGAIESAHAALDAAMAIWRAETPAYPLQWLAIWPLAHLLLEQEKTSEARKLLTFLLDETQERLPDDLELLVRRLDEGGSTELKDAIATARRRGYL
jgi:serine/threonine protein kinase/tetratricopeptide (TPR) repeat protein